MLLATHKPADFGPLINFTGRRVDSAGEIRPDEATAPIGPVLVHEALIIFLRVLRFPLQIVLVPRPRRRRYRARAAAFGLAAVEEAPAVEPAGLPRHAGTAAALSTSAAAHSSCGVSARSATPSATVRA